MTEHQAKRIARKQCPGNLGYTRRHRRLVQGVLMHRIIREVRVPEGTKGLKSGDVISFPNHPDVNAQGLFRVVVLDGL